MEPTDISAQPVPDGGSTPRPGTADRAPEYEFTELDQAVIRSLSSKMRFVGLFALGVGVLVIVMGIYPTSVSSILAGTLYAVIGLWTHRASLAFHGIAETRGRDISLLMMALRDLRNLYTLQFWICTLTLAVGLFVLVLQVRQYL